MKQPYKPTKPELPEQRYFCNELNYDVWETIKVSELDKYLTKVLDMYKNPCYPNLKIEGDWKLEEIRFTAPDNYDDTCGVTLVWRGGQISWDNQSYNLQLKRYKQKLKGFEEKLAQYEENYKKYISWKQNQDKLDEQKEQEYLKKQLEQIKKKLKKYGNPVI